ncbi:complement receptor type 1-like isoform X5 [Conger conger]|uniref:complement receptor type 1-like isoform X5 n=1 Tax=Conger conger TaxID=82655 RepID=UPI002A5AAC95|nr:complement receptor type 1-like isoform X5 [Conger conger]
MPRFGDLCSFLVSTLCLCLLLADCVKGQCQVPLVKTGIELTDESAGMDTFPEGSSVTLQCGKGYSKTSGSGIIHCANGVWTDETLQCQKKSCGSPGDLLNGKFTTPDGTEFGATAYASCNRGFVLLGTAYRQCYDFGWNNRIPLCEVVKCGDPPKIDNGTITSLPSGELYVFSEIVTYTCDRNFNFVGDSQLVCNEDGKYNGTVPECKGLNCPTPIIEHADRIEGGPPPYKLKYFVVYKCRDGYEMKGERKLVCEANGWSSDFPTCVKVPSTTKPTTTKPGVPTPPPTGKPTPPKPGVPTPPATGKPTPPKPGTNLTWLWVVLGILFALALAACGCWKYIGMKKKRARGYRGQMTKVAPQECDQ